MFHLLLIKISEKNADVAFINTLENKQMKINCELIFKII